MGIILLFRYNFCKSNDRSIICANMSARFCCVCYLQSSWISHLSGLLTFSCIMLQIMYVISVLSLRSPENAARAIEAGAGDLAIQAMQKFPAAQQMQRHACLMIRNLVARNPENRQVFYISIYNISSV